MPRKRLNREEREVMRQKHKEMADFKIKNLELFMNEKPELSIKSE